MKRSRFLGRLKAYVRSFPQMTLTLPDLSAYLGLIAVGAVTINMLLGTLMAFRYSPKRSWPHRRFNYFRLHNWTGYLALFFSVVHPLVLLFIKSPRYRLLDLLYPIHAPQQAFESTLGAISIYTLAVIVVTSYARIRLGRHVWKAFHFSIYLAAVALFWHSLIIDPTLNHISIDWLDGGKLFVLSCTVIILVTSLLRWRHSRLKSLQLKQTSRQAATST